MKFLMGAVARAVLAAGRRGKARHLLRRSRDARATAYRPPPLTRKRTDPCPGGASAHGVRLAPGLLVWHQFGGSPRIVTEPVMGAR